MLPEKSGVAWRNGWQKKHVFPKPLTFPGVSPSRTFFFVMTYLASTSKTSSRGGFTLLEILIAIALLAAIAALLISNLDRVLGGGRTEIARIFVNETMENPLMQYRIHMGQFPTTEQGFEALLRRPSEEATNWQGPYIRRLSNDPWGNPYQYRFPGEKNPGSYDLWSLGPDGVDSDANIGNWEKSERD